MHEINRCLQRTKTEREAKYNVEEDKSIYEKDMKGDIEAAD